MDLFADDPMARPLTYPGRLPAGSGVLVDHAYVPLRVEGGEQDRWRADGESVGALLAREGGAPMRGRHRVVAVGSNAAPGQLRAKFRDHGVRPLVPMTAADVTGVAPGVSAHVSRWGYVPAAPIAAPGETSRLFVLWLDEEQLAALDLTEPNYVRRRLAAQVVVGAPLKGVFVYEGRHGCVADGNGRPRRLTSQRALVRSLLDASPSLRHVCGDTPEDFVDNVRDDTVRAEATRILQADHRTGAGRVGPRE
ncbi:hypothetical protein AB0C28_39925 [Nonomuraea sp. NPDC048892]|uniref:hypothetical protein n=1 Tax=Nonomuraea sp. NPDC048892 TaxID=3154624 RepID=UPI000AC3C624